MSIGLLRLDLDYASHNHPTQKWVDQDKYEKIEFQYDPEDLKWTHSSGWKPGKDDDVRDDLTIPWNFTEVDRRRELEMTLVLNDYAVEYVRYSTRQIIDALEAWGKPIYQPFVQPLYIRFVKTTPIVKNVSQVSIVEEPPTQVSLSEQEYQEQKSQSLVRWNEADVYKEFDFNKYKVKSTQSATGPAVGLLDTAKWHPPRPLLLRLLGPEEWRCMVKAMEVSYIRFDRKTGVPTIADVKLTLIERFGLPENGGGMQLPQSHKIDEVPTLEAFTEKVQSGAIRPTAPLPKWQDRYRYKIEAIDAKKGP